MGKPSHGWDTSIIISVGRDSHPWDYFACFVLLSMEMCQTIFREWHGDLTVKIPKEC